MIEAGPLMLLCDLLTWSFRSLISLKSFPQVEQGNGCSLFYRHMITLSVKLEGEFGAYSEVTFLTFLTGRFQQ